MQAVVQTVGWKLRSRRTLGRQRRPRQLHGIAGAESRPSSALALTNDARIIALDSLEVVANQAGIADRIVAVADAQRERIYTAWFERKSEGLARRIAPTTLESTEEWLRIIAVRRRRHRPRRRSMGTPHPRGAPNRRRRSEITVGGVAARVLVHFAISPPTASPTCIRSNRFIFARAPLEERALRVRAAALSAERDRRWINGRIESALVASTELQ